MTEGCGFFLRPLDLPLQKNALRIEAITPSPSCALKPKTDQFGREYNVIRWVMSGGCPNSAAHPCTGSDSPSCPLKNERKDESHD